MQATSIIDDFHAFCPSRWARQLLMEGASIHLDLPTRIDDTCLPHPDWVLITSLQSTKDSNRQKMLVERISEGVSSMTMIQTFLSHSWFCCPRAKRTAIAQISSYELVHLHVSKLQIVLAFNRAMYKLYSTLKIYL